MYEPEDLGEQRTCTDCNQVFVITPKERDFFLGRELSLPSRCKDCREAKRTQHNNDHLVVATPTCVNCQQMFEVTKGEADWMKAKGYGTPIRCKTCRAIRKQERVLAEQRGAAERVWPER